MNNRERTLAILSYEPYDRLPLVHFGFWTETLAGWRDEGHVTAEEAEAWGDGNAVDRAITTRLGFDYNWSSAFGPVTRLLPSIEREVLEELPDGSRKVLNENGAVVIEKEGACGIPPEVDHILKSRKEWEEFFLPRLRFSEERITGASVQTDEGSLPFTAGGLEHLQRGAWENPYGLYCGSLLGVVRDWLGLVQLSYLMVDDSALFDEIVETVGGLCLRCVEAALETGARFDFGHFWEDICFRSGPLVSPKMFAQKVGPHYRRITDLLGKHDVKIVSLDCDGRIDKLVPIWLENGVNTMFPIEVGVWNASIAPWREQYGRDLRGVGGMDKRVFARDRAAVDAEVERLRPLVELGGYIPCPDHRIPPDARWEIVQYYCERMRQVFG
jgi:uroporphyrinogen decarboxylase